MTEPILHKLNKQFQRFYIAFEAPAGTYYYSDPIFPQKERLFTNEIEQRVLFLTKGWAEVSLAKIIAELKENNSPINTELIKVKTLHGDFEDKIPDNYVCIVDKEQEKLLAVPYNLRQSLWHYNPFEKGLRWLLIRNLIKNRIITRENYPITIAATENSTDRHTKLIVEEIRKQTGKYIGRKHFMKASKTFYPGLLSWDIAPEYDELVQKLIKENYTFFHKDEIVEELSGAHYLEDKKKKA